MLLPRLERHPERRLAVRIARDSDNAPRNVSLELVACREVSGVRSAVAERYAEALRIPDDDVTAPFPGRRQKHETQKIRGDCDKGIGGMDVFAQLRVVEHRAVGRRVLDERAEHIGSDLEILVARDAHPYSANRCPRLQHIDRLRMTLCRDEKNFLARLAFEPVAHRHRFARRGPFIQKRCIRNRKPREVANHGLKSQQRFEPALRDLGLVRRVRGVPAGILDDVSLDHRRSHAIRVTHADE